MDPPALISQNLFSSANTSSFSLAEIWPFPLNGTGGCVGESSGVFGARKSHFAQKLSGFGNHDVFGEESTVTEQIGRNGNRSWKKRRDSETQASEDEFSKLISSSSGKEMNDCEAKRLKSSGSGEENGDSKVETESSSGGNKPEEQITEKSEPPKQDYIHVRARRGQATDSHSLAERARREKISDRMKILQDLVPGCNKMTGKALVLDEIINYVQSLQCQVEFLSMKLEAVNSGPDPSLSIEGFPLKNFGALPFETTGVAFGTQATRENNQGLTPEWLHMQVGGGFERTT